MSVTYPTKCPDCGGELVSGALIDHAHSIPIAQRFGKVVKPDSQHFVLFGGEKAFSEFHQVITYNCVRCHRLFSYTDEKVETTSGDPYLKTLSILILIAIAFYLLVVFLR